LRSECFGRGRRLDQIVKWEGDDVVFHFPRIGDSKSESWRHRGHLRQHFRDKQGLPLFKQGSRIDPARWFLTFALDDWLRELEGSDKPIAARMVWSSNERRGRFVFEPSSLLGAMVCQFAASVHGTWPFKECAHCHKFFRLAPGINRANRLTCSVTCKQYLHNGRVARACQLHAAGRTVQEIARELKVKPQGGKLPTDIVGAWVAK